MRLRWGIVGNSRIARQYMQASIAQAGDIVAGTLSRSVGRPIRTEDEQVLHGLVVDSWEKFLGLDLDVIYISGGNGSRVGDLVEAFDAECHILCEKPVCISQDELNHINSMRLPSAVTLGVNHHLRFSNVHKKLKAFVQSSQFGVLRKVSIRHMVKLPTFLRGWRWQDPTMGGCVLDITCHDIDLLKFLTESDLLDIKLVQSRKNSYGCEVWVTSAGCLTNNVLFELEEGFDQAGYPGIVELFFDTAYVRAQGSLSQDGSGSIEIFEHDERVCVERVEKTDLYFEIVKSFRQSMQEKRAHAIDFKQGLDNTAWALRLKLQL